VPTPFSGIFTLMPIFGSSSSSFGPTPESFRSCGVLYAPAEMMTSRDASARFFSPSTRPSRGARGSALYADFF